MNKAVGERDIELESFLRWPFFLNFIFNTILAQTAIQREFPSKWSKWSFLFFLFLFLFLLFFFSFSCCRVSSNHQILSKLGMEWVPLPGLLSLPTPKLAEYKPFSRCDPGRLWSFLYWSIVDFQCCVTFYCTAKWYSNSVQQKYQFYILFHYGLSQDFEYSSIYSRTLFSIHSMFNSLNLLISNSQSILSLLPLKRGNHKSVLCLWVCFCFVDKFICVIF